MRPGIISLRLLAVLVFCVVSTAHAEVPFPASAGQPNPYDYRNYLFIGSGDCSLGNASVNDLPAAFDCEGDWKFTDYRDTSVTETASNPQEFYGVKGAATNRAWEVTTGRPDVVIAVLDSGIRWEDSRPQLVNKYYLNRGELPMPAGGPNASDTRFDGYDVNGDGAFNMADYAADGSVSDLNGNGMKDPEDLIRIFSDGVDGDANGYVDDISGWDFYENDNNPQDDVDYGHGTGEAEDSTAESDSTQNFGDGQCPNCMMMTMRVGSSFVADVNHFAEAVVYATDNGALVVQEALGTLNHTSFGQRAIDYAYSNGVIINASEADEAAGHHMWPAAYDHTMVVNSITEYSLPTTIPRSTLYFNGCTNFGGYTYLSIPSSACSSEATGRSSGISGLLYSAAKNAIEGGNMTPYIRDDGTLANYPLSAEEARQLWRLAGDDIDFASTCPGHAFCNDTPPDVTTPTAPPQNYATSIPDTTRYQTVKGWDYFTGYGRANNGRLTHYIGLEGVPGVGPREFGPASLSAQDRIPPEADIASPRWWAQFPYLEDFTLLEGGADEIVIDGHAAANRVTAAGGTFDYVLEWAPHVQGGLTGAPATDSDELSSGPWTEVTRATGLSSAVNGELGRISVAALAAGLAGTANPFTPANDPTSAEQPERYAIRLRLRVLAHPVLPADVVNNEAVMQKQIDVYPAQEAWIGDKLGIAAAPTGGAGSPSFHDLDGDGVDELILTTSDGQVHAYTDVTTGAELPGWPVHTTPYQVQNHMSGDNAYTRGDVPSEIYSAVLLGTPAIGDLDDDGKLEVVVADMSGVVHAWQVDGTPRSGFPITVDRDLSQEPACAPTTIPACDDYEPPPLKRNQENNRDWAITSAPVLGNLDPTTSGLEIVFGSNDGHVYAFHADGAPVAGWPVTLRDPAKVATMDPTTRFVTYVSGAANGDGTKVMVSPSLGDIDGDGDLEVIAPVNEQYVETPNADGSNSVVLPIVGQLADPGNSRVYALHHDGAAHSENAPDVAPNVATTPHTQDQAYVLGWPVPIALLVTELLPEVGAGADGQAALVDVDDDGTLEIAVASAAGPGYVLDHDGASFYGNGPSGLYNTLSTEKGASSGATDLPSYVAVSALTVGSLDGGLTKTVAGAGAGLRRLLDIILEGDQAFAEDHLQLWQAATGQSQPNAPIVVNDLQFFTPPTFADITGDGLAEAIQSTAVGDTVAVSQVSTELTVQRFFTGGWIVAAATVGRAPGLSEPGMHMATVTREGYLRLYPTGVAADGSADCVALSEWPEYGHDAWNSGNYETDAERPYPLRDVTAPSVVFSTSVLVNLTATGDDRACGSADRYEIRRLPGDVANPDWLAAVPLQTSPVGASSGSPDSILVENLMDGEQTLLIRAFDDADNGSAPSRLVVVPEPRFAIAALAGVCFLAALSRRRRVTTR